VSPLDTYGANTLLGSPVYVDTNGQLRTQPRGIDVIATPAMRPDQYPGRVYVRSDTFDFAWSNGSAWQPFAVASPEMIPVPRYRARLAGNISIPSWAANREPTWLQFASQYGPEWHDPMGHLEFATVAGIPAVRALIAGMYQVRCSVQWAPGQANGTRKLGLWRTTDTVAFASDERTAAITTWSGGPSSLSVRTEVSGLVYLAAGDYVRVGATSLAQNATQVFWSGSAATNAGGYADSYFEMYKVGSMTRQVFTP
jgi:hypothetical protein